jgi:hypothetical protein
MTDFGLGSLASARARRRATSVADMSVPDFSAVSQRKTHKAEAHRRRRRWERSGGTLARPCWSPRSRIPHGRPTKKAAPVCPCRVRLESVAPGRSSPWVGERGRGPPLAGA